MPVTYSRKEAIANACGPKGPAAGKPMGVRFSLPVSLPIRQPFLVLYTTSKRSSRQFSSQLEARRKVLKSPCDHSAIRNSVVCPLTSDLRPLTSCCLLVPSEVAGLPAANWQLFAVVCHLSSVVFFPYAPRSMPSDPQYTRTVKNGKDLFDRLSQINQLA